MTLPPPQLDWHSATLFVVSDPLWRQKIIRAGWILMIPLIGWPIILGYRSDAVFRLLSDEKPLLPEWNRGLWHFLCRGLKAMVVINLYYLPVWIYLIFKFASSEGSHEIPWVWLAVFFAVLPIFSTLIIPTLVFWGHFLVGVPVFSLAESFTLGAIASTLTFLIPSGFLNVSKTGRLRSALNFPAGLRLVRETFPRYMEAWIGSGVISLIGHLCVPFSPWGVVWCYLAIIYAFNEVPLTRKNPLDRAYLAHSAFARFRESFWKDYICTYRSRFRERWTQEGIGSFTVIRLGPIRVPF